MIRRFIQRVRDNWFIDEEFDDTLPIDATWSVPVAGSIHKVVQYNNELDGYKMIAVDGKVVCDDNYKSTAFNFKIGDLNCKAIQQKCEDFFCWLEISGKPLKEYKIEFYKRYDTWKLEGCMVVIDKITLDVWINGEKMNAEREFIDGGTRTTFSSMDKEFLFETKGSPGNAFENTLCVNGDVIIIPKYTDLSGQVHKNKVVQEDENEKLVILIREIEAAFILQNMPKK
uniref:YopX domain-containing protein n=1 Tax=Caenorhabditis tropicalis TaxID=1561998 RepID=A0A1I7URD0_9PELO